MFSTRTCSGGWPFGAVEFFCYLRTMNEDFKYSELLDSYIKMFRREITWLEFKSNYQDADHLGKYISSISNSACLAHQEFGYLFFGVDNDTLEVKGTTFDVSDVKAKGNQALLLYLKLYITPKVDFRFEELSMTAL